VGGNCLGTGPYISATSGHNKEHMKPINITRNLFSFSFKRRTPFHRVKLSGQQMPSHKFVTVVLGANAILAATENRIIMICGRKSNRGAGFLSELRSYSASFLPIFHSIRLLGLGTIGTLVASDSRYCYEPLMKQGLRIEAFLYAFFTVL